MPPTLTEQELNAPGGMSTAQGGYMTGMNDLPPSPNTVPAVAPANVPNQTSSPTPTTDYAGELDRIKSQAGVAQSMLDEIKADEQTVGQSFDNPEYTTLKSYDELYPDIDEDSIRRNQMKMFQGQIDATNTIYDQMLNEARMEGQGRLGSQRAMAARGGLLGSDFGASQKQKVQGFNTDVNNAIQAERAAKIGNILGTVRSAVTAQLAEKRAARQQGAENYLNYLKNESTIRQGNINQAAQAMLAQGIDPSTLDENELGAIALEAGVKPADITMAYQQLVSQQEEGETFTLRPGERRYNAAGELLAEGKGEPTILKEGDVILDEEGNIVRKIDKTSASGISGSDSFGSFSTTDEQTLLGGGWSRGEIETIASGVEQFGLQEVIEREREEGAAESQINALQNVYGVEADPQQSITRETITNLWGLSDKGTDNSLWPGEQNDEDAIDTLMAEVEAYRNAGYTDKEILDIML